MKRIKQISGRAIKGLTFTTPLSPVTLLVGDNFEGKTTRTDALRLALLGHLPELGKNNKDTMGLASGREMHVEATGDDGTVISRTFKMKGDSVSKEVSVPQALEDCEQLVVMLDATQYFNLSDRARVEYVFANCPVTGLLTPEQIIARVYDKTPGLTFPTVIGSMSSQNFVELSIEHFTAIAKAARAYAAKMEGTVQGLAALRAGDDAAKVAANLTALDARRNQLSTQLRELDGKAAALRAEREQQDKARRRHEVITRELELADHEGKRSKLAALREQLSALPAPITADPGRAADLRKREMELNSQLVTARNDYRNAQSLYAAGERQMAELEGQKTCPYCGAAGEGWKTLKRVETNEAFHKLTADMNAAKERGVAVNADIAALQAEIKVEAEKAKTAMHAAGEEQRLRREISDLETLLARLSAIAEEKKAMGDMPPADDTAIKAVLAELANLQDEAHRIDQDRRAAMGRQHELGRLAQAEEERDKAKAEETAAKASTEELRVIQAEMVEAAFKPLLDLANRIFDGVLKSPLAYRDGEIGTWRAGAWVGYRTFSGLEQALCFAAMQAALAAMSPLKIMIIDELGRFTNKKARAVVECALRAVKRGDIDQFIGVKAVDDVAQFWDHYRDLVVPDGSELTIVDVSPSSAA
jgi:hypothetical protein